MVVYGLHDLEWKIIVNCEEDKINKTGGKQLLFVDTALSKWPEKAVKNRFLKI